MVWHGGPVEGHTIDTCFGGQGASPIFVALLLKIADRLLDARRLYGGQQHVGGIAIDCVRDH